jgi:hypothetical protein
LLDIWETSTRSFHSCRCKNSGLTGQAIKWKAPLYLQWSFGSCATKGMFVWARRTCKCWEISLYILFLCGDRDLINNLFDFCEISPNTAWEFICMALTRRPVKTWKRYNFYGIFCYKLLTDIFLGIYTQ